MSTDPIVEEVRKARREIEKECGDDPEAYYRHLLENQAKLQDRLVRGKPRLVHKKAG
jgi:hypothetical protein